MKYLVLIIDGAADWPLEDYGDKTCLELARTPDLDLMAREGLVGLARTVPAGMEPSSACACMSIMGYDPEVYFSGRGPIEAKSMGITLAEGEVAFRCNLVAVRGGRMWSYCAGHISNAESHAIIDSLNKKLGDGRICFYPGVGYRHICTIKDGQTCLESVCTPPHDIADQPIAEFLPHGVSSRLLVDIMQRSKAIIDEHPVNMARKSRGDIPASMVWLFWGGGAVPDFPSFRKRFGLRAAMTSGVDLLKGLARLAGMTVLEIPGVTDNIDNDHAAQGEGALAALEEHDIVFIHIEAPDEAAHEGRIDQKVEAIEQIDKLVISRFRSRQDAELRVLVLPDHATPIKIMTHTPDMVPFVFWGPGFKGNGARAFSETSAGETGLFIERGHDLLEKLISSFHHELR